MSRYCATDWHLVGKWEFCILSMQSWDSFNGQLELLDRLCYPFCQGQPKKQQGQVLPWTGPAFKLLNVILRFIILPTFPRCRGHALLQNNSGEFLRFPAAGGKTPWIFTCSCLENMLAEKLYKMTLNNLKTLAENLALPLLRQVALTKIQKG